MNSPPAARPSSPTSRVVAKQARDKEARRGVRVIGDHGLIGIYDPTSAIVERFARAPNAKVIKRRDGSIWIKLHSHGDDTANLGDGGGNSNIATYREQLDESGNILQLKPSSRVCVTAARAIRRRRARREPGRTANFIKKMARRRPSHDEPT